MIFTKTATDNLGEETIDGLAMAYIKWQRLR